MTPSSKLQEERESIPADRRAPWGGAGGQETEPRGTRTMGWVGDRIPGTPGWFAAASGPTAGTSLPRFRRSEVPSCGAKCPVSS